MKKIGLVTFHESANYGTCLQALAVQTMTEQFGNADVEIVRFERPNVVRRSKWAKVLSLLSLFNKEGFSQLLTVIFLRWKIRLRKGAFARFREKFFKYSGAKYTTIEQLAADEHLYSAFVVGSDMVWAVDRAVPLEVFFLRFTAPEKRIAYAPSIGSSTIREDLQGKYAEYAREITYLSCREKSGCDLISGLTGRDVVYVADPTILLSAQEWLDLLQIEKAPNAEKYMFSYVFDGLSSENQAAARKLCKLRSWDLKRIPMALMEHLRTSEQSGLGPVEFVKYIANASFVITNSYHGLVFSIIFRKPFCVLGRPEGVYWMQFEDRLLSLLDRLGLASRRVTSIADITPEMLELDYGPIEDKIEGVRALSRRFLADSLAAVFKSGAGK